MRTTKYIIALCIIVLISTSITPNILAESYSSQVYPYNLNLSMIDSTNKTIIATNYSYPADTTKNVTVYNLNSSYFYSCKLNLRVDKTFGIIASQYTEALIQITYPNGYSKVTTDYLSSYTVVTNSHYNLTINFPFNTFGYAKYPINQTGNYYLNITTILYKQISVSPYYEAHYFYSNYILNITEEYIAPITNNVNIYGASFIGMIAGFTCLFSLFAIPMVCAYKIKHTGEKLKWSVYGFLLICIIFFCMIAFFQMG